jgi:hypothetical protein
MLIINVQKMHLFLILNYYLIKLIVKPINFEICLLNNVLLIDE